MISLTGYHDSEASHFLAAVNMSPLSSRPTRQSEGGSLAKWLMQVQVQVVEALVSTRCGVAGIRAGLMHSPDMLQSSLRLLLVVFRLSTAACEAAVGASFPQVCICPLSPLSLSQPSL